METNQDFLSITNEQYETISKEKWSFQRIQAGNKTTIIATNERGTIHQIILMNVPEDQELKFFGHIVK